MSKKNIIILVALVVVVGLGMFFFSTRDKVKAPSVENPEDAVEPVEPVEPDKEEVSQSHPVLTEIIVGELAPDFTLNNLEGEEVNLSDYRGKLVFLNFWATWCPPCAKEMPDLQAINKDNDDLVVLGVNVREDKNTVESYLDKGGYDFPVLLDEKSEIAATYLVNAFPSTFFINSQGELLSLLYDEDILVDLYRGSIEKEQMEEILGKMRELEN